MGTRSNRIIVSFGTHAGESRVFERRETVLGQVPFTARDHRVALTRIFTASHGLGVERGRWITVRNSSVHESRAFQLCYMCHGRRDAYYLQMPTLPARGSPTFPALRYAPPTPRELFHVTCGQR